MNKMYPLFPQAVFTVESTRPRFNNVIDFCKTLDYGPNGGGNFTSVNTDILSHTMFSEIRSMIESAIDEYTKNVMEWKANFYVIQSWINKNPPNTAHHEHYHANSFISGVFYLKPLRPDFLTFGSGKQLTLAPPTLNFNMWNSQKHDLPLNDNMIVLFPSTLLHSVGENKTNETRFSLAFNVFLEGVLGAEKVTSQLRLTKKVMI